MLRQSIRLATSKRALSVTPRRNNLISDFYIQQVKQFKPTPISSAEVDNAVKKFQLPGKPAIPDSEIPTLSLSEYENAPVDVLDQTSSSTEAPAADEDWFVFEEAEEHH